MIRKTPKELDHGGGSIAPAVGSMDGFSPLAIVLEPIAMLTGAGIEDGTCDGCHYRFKDDPKGVGYAEAWSQPSFSATAQILTKAGIALATGVVAALVFGGRIATIGGLVAGNLVARPIVDAIARMSGPAAPAPKNAEILPSSSPKAAMVSA